VISHISISALAISVSAALLLEGCGTYSGAALININIFFAPECSAYPGVALIQGRHSFK